MTLSATFMAGDAANSVSDRRPRRSILQVQKPRLPSLRHGRCREVKGFFWSGFLGAGAVAQEKENILAVEILQLGVKLAGFHGKAKTQKSLVSERQIALSLGRVFEAVRNIPVTRKEIDDVETQRAGRFQDRIEWRVQREAAVAEPSPGDLHRGEFRKEAATCQRDPSRLALKRNRTGRDRRF
ncbi:hypothetical protein [Bradyrhizobium sp. USDA 4486]